MLYTLLAAAPGLQQAVQREEYLRREPVHHAFEQERPYECPDGPRRAHGRRDRGQDQQ